MRQVNIGADLAEIEKRKKVINIGDVNTTFECCVCLSVKLKNEDLALPNNKTVCRYYWARMSFEVVDVTVTW